jgi:4'-phosphopantetheinyl transferase
MTAARIPDPRSLADLAARELPGQVHVWRAPLDLETEQLQLLRGLLSADERLRAAAFRFRSDRDRFAAGRGWLRWLLGRYLGRTPAGVRLRNDAGGKPALAGEADDGLRFNVSHSAGLALVAMTWAREVGVDVERIGDDFPGLDVARRFFSRGEVAVLEALPPAFRIRAFYDCWTRKEAYLKARGVGLALALDRFEVSFGPGQAPALRVAGSGGDAFDPDEDELRRWSVHALDAGPGYAAALVLEGSAGRIRTADCEPRWLRD